MYTRCGVGAAGCACGERRMRWMGAAAASLLMVLAAGGCTEHRVVVQVEGVDAPELPAKPPTCAYDRRSWQWNMAEGEFYCVIDELEARAKRGDAQAFRDLTGWANQNDTELAEYISYAIWVAYEHLGHERFMCVIEPLTKRDKADICGWVLSEMDPTQATVDRFRAELGVTTEELPFYPDSTADESADDVPSDAADDTPAGEDK